MSRWIKPLASLRLTVVLLALAMLLIFVGTIAQTRLGVWQAVESYFRSPIAWVDPALFIPADEETGATPQSAVRIPIPGGLSIAALMIVNLLAAHIARFRATRRRVGVLVLHAGLILLLVGEFVTGFYADEGLMAIDEGATSSFIEDIRTAELAVIDPSDPAHDRVVVIPGSMLSRAAKSQQPIDDPRLPFSVIVEQWMPNAALFRSDSPTADHGFGLAARAEPRPRVAGVDASASDTPAAYISLVADNQTLGTWLVSAAIAEPQPVLSGNSTFGLSLRYARTYLPFSLHLIDFRHDTFTGTNIARNFSSDIRLLDPARQTDRELRIWMNNPLRYQGLTFYQASYKPDGSGTVLQVVRNPGWLLPYLACILVGGGMTFHFAQTLIAFLRRRAQHGPIAAASIAQPCPRWWPLAIACVGLAIATSALFRPAPKSDFNIAALAHIPVSSGGRIKPLDTAARSALMVAGGRQQVRTDEATISATQFLLHLITQPKRVADLPIVRIDHPDVLALLHRSPEEGGRIPLSAIEPHWQSVGAQAQQSLNTPPRQRDAFQRAVIEAHDRVNTLLMHARMHQPLYIAPLGPDDDWKPFHSAFLEAAESLDPHPSVAFLTSIMIAAADEDAPTFNARLDRYIQLLDASMPNLMQRMRLEVLFNRASLFSGTTAVYVLALLAVCASFLARSRSPILADRLRIAAWSLLVAGVLVHTLAIALRIHLQGRPPVTNLYSSAIFVGWAAALAGIFVERLYPIGVAIVGSVVVGASTLIVAHNLGNDGDTMQMMQAVLDSNFWLATHVITITLGYSATFLAGAIASVFLIQRALCKTHDREREVALTRMTYGTVCFALLLSFVGTVLGGIWADQSWGRFWGWDPKENGAALVVLINAIILHARWGGLIKSTGIAVLAVAGNIVTAWSWFGTNLLGVGLHAYGFMESGVFWIGLFVLSQIGIMTLGYKPHRSAEMQEKVK